jgi:hypothetical protein
MRHFADTVVAALLALALSGAAHAGQPVLQRGYDAGVSGTNLTEVILNTSNVSPATFGLAFNLPVDDRIYAQPLYVPGVAIPNQGTHNVIQATSQVIASSTSTSTTSPPSSGSGGGALDTISVLFLLTMFELRRRVRRTRRWP